ncbi:MULTISPECIES: hypothetical protein [unclassified Serratia (in: enterobacteria)]|uniref:hypothetical protein n=1 Tax=unclassified Serratia (in: enterobacteria) TaxID=2647522 RepID=UPI0030764B8B
MITTLFYVLCGFAVLHFIYERIVQPSLRLHFRNELFKVRDCVRNEIIEGKLGKDLAAANLMHEGLNNTINRLHMLTLGNKWRAQQRFETDKVMRATVLEQSAILYRIENEALKKSLRRTVKIMDYVLISNNGLFMIYSFPLVVFITLCSLAVAALRQSLRIVNQRIIRAKDFEKSILLMNDSFVNQAVYAH